MSVTTVNLGSGADDGFETNSSAWNGTNSEWKVGAVSGGEFDGGLRFQLNVPKNATINTGTQIDMYVNTANNSGASYTIYADDDADDAPAWGASSRPSQISVLTSASESGGSSGAGAKTQDVQSIVQEIVNRSGWQPNFHIRFPLFNSAPTTAYNNWYVAAQEATSGPGAGGATLTVNYTAAPAGNTSNPSQGSIVFSGKAPTATATAHHFPAPGKGTIVFSGFAPAASVTAGQTATPDNASITFSGYAPTATATANHFPAPEVGAIVFSGFAPTASVAAGQTASPSNAVITFSGYAPAPWVSMGSGDITIVVDAPEPSMGQITFTGYAPTASNSQNATAEPSFASIVFTGQQPTATTTASHSISPDVVQISFAGYAPTLDTGIRPGSGTLTFTGYGVTVQVSEQFYSFPEFGSIAFTGYAPSVSGGIAIAPSVTRRAGGGPKKSRRTVILPDKRIVRADQEEIQRLLQFYKVSQEELEKQSEPVQKASRRQRRKYTSSAIPAPQIIEELEEAEDLEFVLKEIARSLS